MKIYPDTKIYVLCPGNVQTGGSELCYKFASKLISFGLDAYIYYYRIGGVDFNKSDPVHNFYEKYHVPYTFKLENDPKNQARARY